MRKTTTKTATYFRRSDKLRAIGVKDRDPRNAAGAVATQSLSSFVAVLHLLDVNLQDKVVIGEQTSIRIEELLEHFAPASPGGSEVHDNAFVVRLRAVKGRGQKHIRINWRDSLRWIGK